MLAIFVGFTIAAAGIAQDDDAFSTQVRVACVAPLGARPIVEDIVVQPVAAANGDLPALRVAVVSTGAWMTVYHDAASEDVAWARASCLGAQLRLLGEATGDRRRDGRWASVVFTVDEGYIPPRDGTDIRWIVTTVAGIGLDAAAQDKLVAVIPHEQVHAFQRRLGAQTPRWFHEGHAEWIGRQVTSILSPAHATEQTEAGAAALAASRSPVALRQWGGVSIRREAILRQVSADDRARMEADPAYAPPGPFSFGPNDMQSDESNAAARYQAAWSLFRDLAQAHGPETVRNWVREATETGSRVSHDDLLSSARRALGSDLSTRFE
jgi:hypothetical protein